MSYNCDGCDSTHINNKGFLQLLRDHYENFELCEYYAFWCLGARGKKIATDKVVRAKYSELARSKIWPSLWNYQNYGKNKL